MNFPHADGSPAETLLKRIATLHKELRYEERHTDRYARLSAAIRELSAAYCAAVDAQPRPDGISVSHAVAASDLPFWGEDFP